MRASSWKAQFRQDPPRSATPPPPAYEPLSPVLQPATPSIANPAGGNAKIAEHSSNGVNGLIHHAPALGRVGRALPPLGVPAAVMSSPPLRVALPPPLPRQNPQQSPTLGSPLDALTKTTVHTSPAIEASRRPSYGLPSPATAIPLLAPSERAPKHTYPDDSIYPYDDRPSKRARSEYLPSPQYAHHASRPSTSHVPNWSYNVEQMADNGMRMYQDNGPPVQHQEDATLKRLSDAQLLLDFAVTASFSSHPKRPARQRWSPPRIVPGQHAFDDAQRNAQLSTNRNPRLEANFNDFQHPEHSRQSLYQHTSPQYEMIPNVESPTSPTVTAAQTQTPPEEALGATMSHAVEETANVEEKKSKKHQGWPKGKPRGPRTGIIGSKKKKSTPKPKSATSTVSSGIPDQLHSPQSLPAEKSDDTQTESARPTSPYVPFSRELTLQTRRHSFSNSFATELPPTEPYTTHFRAQSVPPDSSATTVPRPMTGQSRNRNDGANQITVCAGCHSIDSLTLIGEGEQWISCDGCKGWYHFVCAGFKSEREVRDVDKFYCPMCSPKFGHTTKVRKSGRAHTAVDYAGLNEGILKTSDDNPEHHYIAAFKNGGLNFIPESFARLPPELITAEYLEKSNGFKEPIVIPAALNPRPKFPTKEPSYVSLTSAQPSDLIDATFDQYGYELVHDDGQDKLDMVIPEGLTVRRVSELYGPLERVPVIDVKAQEGEDKRWTMAKWADYYEQEGEKPVRNVISLEVSRSRLGRLIQRPKAVRDMDLQDSIWPEDDKHNAPPVQFYCLMSVADCYTDFHIDFGGSSVFYHIIKGRKTFFFIPPTKQNLKKYEDWCLSPKMGHEFLGHQVKECYRIDLYPGDTMLIPSGWIHAVWTPEDSLVIGGNFLTRIHYGMQIKVLEIEKNTKVAPKFRYPYFQKIMWLVVIKYLEDDRLPASVEQLLLKGSQFYRRVPIYCETDKFGHNSHPGLDSYNARYYSKAELNGFSDLASYIWRTVMISLGKVEGVTQTVRNAVTRSIPKGHGEPITLARRFAMWSAWKKGNETIPQWAFPNATLPETTDLNADKKPGAVVGERQSTRIKGTEPVEPSPPNEVDSREQSVAALPMTGFLRPSTDLTRHMSAHMSTPKTSQLGPKRIACDACRKRRIRCKHKDEIVETKSANGSANGAISTIDLSGSLPISVKRRGSEADLAFGPILNAPNLFDAPAVNAGPISADLSTDPFALKSGRVKACADCRKSKRRCIHDEHGNIDPVKASETPIPRGSATKKRRVSEGDSGSVNRKMKESTTDRGTFNSDLFAQDSMQTPSRAGGSMDLPDTTMYSPQDEQSPENSIPIDPALQSFNDKRETNAFAAPVYSPHRDTIMSSIENSMDDVMEDIIETRPKSYIDAIVEPRTPGPPPHIAAHHKSNGANPGLSSPLSPLAPSSSSTGGRNALRHAAPNHTNSSRVGSQAKTSQTPRSTNKVTHTPKSSPGSGGRRDSKETIKLEPGARNKSMEDDKPEDVASLALALQLQMEEHGLRRRSK